MDHPVAISTGTIPVFLCALGNKPGSMMIACVFEK